MFTVDSHPFRRQRQTVMGCTPSDVSHELRATRLPGLLPCEETVCNCMRLHYGSPHVPACPCSQAGQEVLERRLRLLVSREGQHRGCLPAPRKCSETGRRTLIAKNPDRNPVKRLFSDLVDGEELRQLFLRDELRQLFLREPHASPCHFFHANGEISPSNRDSPPH